MKQLHQKILLIAAIIIGQCCAINIYAQSSTESKKEPYVLNGCVMEQGRKTTIPGATIIVEEEPSRGTIAAMDGTFSIKVTPGETIIVSYLGMEEFSLPIVYGMKDFTIELKPSSINITDVVVTGYAVQKRNEVVGAVETIKGSDIENVATSSLEQMLQGKISGVVINSQSGTIGKRQTVKVRGTSTLLGNQEPVWVVDGMIQEDPIPFETTEFNSFGGVSSDNIDMVRNFVGNAISWLNPSDIADIAVLKDASATAIYGVKAANGVIVITTKRGEKGSVSVNYSGNVSVNEKITYEDLNLMNSKQRVDLTREILTGGYVQPADLSVVGYEGAYLKYMNGEITFDEFNTQAKYYETLNTDWLDILMRTGISHNHSVSVSGGNDRISYYSSLNAGAIQGEAIGNDQSNYGASLSINAWIIPKRLSLNSRLSGSYSTTSGFYGVDPYGYATSTSRAMPAYVDGEPYFYSYSGSSKGFLYNFEHERDNSGNSNTSSNLNGYTSLNYRTDIGLNLEASLGYGVANTIGSSYKEEQTYAMTEIRGYEFGSQTPSDNAYKQSRLPHGGIYNHMESRNMNYTFRLQANYNKMIQEDHRVNGSLGYEVRSSKYDGFNMTEYGYMHDRGRSFTTPPQMVLQYNGEGWERNDLWDQCSRTVNDRLSNFMSMYAMGGYSYKERYIVSATIRQDASNRFGQDSNNKFLPIFSLGTRWNASQEAWLINNEVINELSVRASYGWQGNVAENFGPELIANIESQPDILTGEYYMTIRSLPYDNLRWEKVSSYNVGLDIGLLQNRLQFSANYYYKRTDDMIVYMQPAMSFGVSDMPINGGNMLNSGWDISVTATPIRTNDFTWNVNFNTAKNYNSIDSTLAPNHYWRTAVSGTMNVQGYPYSSVWGFKYKGLDADTGAPIFYTAEEINPDYDPEDASTFMEYLGTLDPDFTGGFSTSFNYKNLTLSATFNMSIGAVRFLQPYINTAESVYTIPHDNQNMSAEFVDRWRKSGDEKNPNTKPALPTREINDYITIVDDAYAYLYQMYNYSDQRIVHADYLRCNSISLSYILPQKLLYGKYIKNVSLSAGLSNPFVITHSDYKGVDPEVATGSQPIMKSVNFGINVTF